MLADRYLNTFCLSGFPKPRVYWFKDGHPLRSSERVLLQVERDVHNLEILEVKREDMGEYSAYISNAAGSAYSSARLSVLSMYLNDCWEWQQKRCLKKMLTFIFPTRSRGDYASG